MPECKHKFVFKNSDGYWTNDGRNSVRYYHVDNYFCEKCLEEKSVDKRHWCIDSERWNAPEWTKLITKQVKGYSNY